MSSKESSLKEKFRIALNSTAKVISDDFNVNKKNLEENIFKEKINASVKRRKDLRSLETFTIDPIDARDFDEEDESLQLHKI